MLSTLTPQPPFPSIRENKRTGFFQKISPTKTKKQKPWSLKDAQTGQALRIPGKQDFLLY